MQAYACKEHVEEGIDYVLNKSAKSPTLAVDETHFCFLCKEKSAYSIFVSEEKIRCKWCGEDEMYRAYHDLAWGVPVFDDAVLFEFLVLESHQAGLSFLTILRKRAHYRKAYDDFNPVKIANYDEAKVQMLLADAGVIRNRKKIESAIQNAKAFLRVQQEFGSFSTYLWGFVDYKPILNHWETESEVPCVSEISKALAKDMKKRGFQFLGPKILYAYMQAMGLVNDHLVSCFRHGEVCCER